MHSLIRLYLKTAFAFLLIGLAIGTTMLVRRELFGVFPAPQFVSAHVHAVVVGFVMMMIMGVALWLFPRPPRKETPSTRVPRGAMVAYWFITLGTLTRITGELVRNSSAARPWAIVVVAGALAQVVGIAVCVAVLWPRIRAAGSAEREARGERF
ncbi:MAG: hypothetical protein ABJC26_08215 [Gemmatimonadaceae bacterium]